MGLVGKVLGVLFGNKPDIFDKDGAVVHKHPPEKWSKWDDRYQSGSEYNWKNHTGTRAGAKKKSSH